MADLTFTKNVRATWDNLAEDPGSDHCILEITVEKKAKATRKFKITDWDQFRKIRERKGNTVLSYEALLNELKMAANEATKEVETGESIPAMDSHLASLLQKKHDLKEAWRKNKLNRHAQKSRTLDAKSNLTPKHSAPSCGPTHVTKQMAN
ncbi:hypothetical protein HPB51_005267 [Rhipicephalus microplus]|uniref:Tick transposon n=1 Tax=Rhipicephalus microplus TaxID=6941 RepID=A0A9J6EQV7_RHIMP|nr:hypothetical protein HPB51_005267 [Rhipicephalus microplus]